MRAPNWAEVWPLSRTFSTKVLHEYPDVDVEQVWRKGLDRMKLPAHYNAPEFFKEPFFEGKQPFAVLAFDGESVAGILTGIHDGAETACGQPARPQACIAEDTDSISAAAMLAGGLLEEAGPTKLVSVYSWAPIEGLGRFGFRVRPLEGNVMLDLSLGPEVLFKQFDENRRRNIRLAIRNRIEVFQLSTPQDVRAYYDVYREWRGTPRKRIVWDEVSFDVFERALALVASRKVFLARYDGRIIAGITLRMYPGGLLEYAAGHAIEEFVRLRPNDLLHWRAIEWACEQGFGAYCLGGAHSFLRRFGGTVVPVYRHRLDRTLLRRIDRVEALQDWRRKSFRRLPSPIQKAIRRLAGR